MSKKVAKKFQSYQAGILDASHRLKVGPPDGIEEGDFEYPNEDKGELDAQEYLRGQVEAIFLYLDGSCINHKEA